MQPSEPPTAKANAKKRARSRTRCQPIQEEIFQIGSFYKTYTLRLNKSEGTFSYRCTISYSDRHMINYLSRMHPHQPTVSRTRTTVITRAVSSARDLPASRRRPTRGRRGATTRANINTSTSSTKVVTRLTQSPTTFSSTLSSRGESSPTSNRQLRE